MGKKSAPPPPDYTAAAEKQGEASKDLTIQQTYANRANEVTPWGNLTWSTGTTIDPSSGKEVTTWTQNQTLDPRLQSSLDSQLAVQDARAGQAQDLIGRMQQEFGSQMDWGSLTPLQQGAQAGPDLQAGPALQAGQVGKVGNLSPLTSAFGFGPRQQRIDTSRQGVPMLNTNAGANAGAIQGGLDFGGVQGVDDAMTTRNRAEDALYGRAASRLDPQWQQRQTSLETDLANRGISQNSEAYSRAMADFDRSRNDAYSQAQFNAITGGGAEAQRDFGMDLGLRQQQVGEIGQQGNFANQAQAQGFGQDLSAIGANNSALGQMFGFGNTARSTQLGAQGQAFDQSLQSEQARLARQQQAFGQQQVSGEQNFGQQQAAGAQNFGQQQAAGAQGFQQALAADAQNFAQQQQAATFNNQMRQQQLSEEMQKRGFSLNEINALLTGQQVQAPQFGGYNQAGLAQTPDYMGALTGNYNAQMDASNAANAGRAQTAQGVAGIASIAAIAF